MDMYTTENAEHLNHMQPPGLSVGERKKLLQFEEQRWQCQLRGECPLMIAVPFRGSSLSSIIKMAIILEAVSTFISYVFFWWVNPVVRLGNRREFQPGDFKVSLDDRSDVLGSILEREWIREKNRGKEQPNLSKALFRAFGIKYVVMWLVPLLEECLFKILQPLCLGPLLIHYFTPGSQMSMEEGAIYATGIVLGPFLYNLTHQSFQLSSLHIGMQMRLACCSLLYKKCLRLSQGSIGRTGIGQVVNLMSNDVNRIEKITFYGHYLIVGPIQTVIMTIALLFIIGPSCLVGLGVLILSIPLQVCLSRIFSQLRLKTTIRTDERIQTMNEILTGMRVLKMYTWEKPFAKLVEIRRKLEMKCIRRAGFLQAFNFSVFFMLSKMNIVLTLVVYFLSDDNLLTPDKAYLTIAFFICIRIVMTHMFPCAVSDLAELKVSIRRIQEFLLLEEKENKMLESNEQCAASDDNCQIDCENVTVKWPEENKAKLENTKKYTLKDVSFSVRHGQVLAVIGQVGSGKSSVLNMILGELEPLQGSCQVKGRVAYASQDPWIFFGTIRENILCGLDLHKGRYNEVIKATALERDLTLFPHGDQTVVGENGIQLSGGQKARVNLARCLYVDADIYLMDDPLSAVDAHVGRHLFNQAINGFLRGKIRILVTHHLWCLKDVDQILVLKEGRVKSFGNYDTLRREGFDHILGKVEEEENEGHEEPEKSAEGTQLSLSATAENINSLARLKTDETAIPLKADVNHEFRSTGEVKLSVYWKYLHSGLGSVSVAFLVISFLICQTLFTSCDYWLNLWSNAVLRVNETNLASTISSNDKSLQKDLDITSIGIYVYAALMAGLCLFSFVRTAHFFATCLSSSVKLHNQMFYSVLRSPLSFFDRTSVGQILDIFSKDIGCMDCQLPPTFYEFISILLLGFSVVVVLGAVNPWLMLPVPFLAIACRKIRQVYLKAARSIKRLESTSKSPTFNHLSSSITGLTTLRAHQGEEIFQRKFDEFQDAHSSVLYVSLGINHWFGYWMEWIYVLYGAVAIYTCLTLRHNFTSSEAGLVICSSIAFCSQFQWGARQSAETENQMASVERVMEFAQLPSEAPLESSHGEKPPSDWPSDGNIVFDQLSLRYNDSHPPVLKNITCRIKAKEKVGIVGRTGAGKSSLISALFRLTEPEGRICIDGIDTKTIGLHDLRSKISIIPQDPFLFSGTLRRNLDLFNEFDDHVLWNALEDVQIKSALKDSSSASSQLEFVVSEGGSNLSVGERQLVCLARALVTKNRILVLDEATANVDHKTDALIQQTVREKFKDCTVLTIAHRLNTIMDSDKIMVLDAGCLMEFDDPKVLLENENGIFYGLAEQAGLITLPISTRL